MADLKAGSTVGGNPIWHAGTFPLVPAGNSLTYRGKKVYTEIDKPQANDNDFVSKANGGTGSQGFQQEVEFKAGVKISATFSGGSNLNGLYSGNGDGDTREKSNMDLRSWYGIGIWNSCTHDGVQGRTIWFSARRGTIGTVGDIVSGSQVIANASTPTAAQHLTRKDYVDDRINTVSNVANAAVRKAGDTMTGILRAEAGVVIVNKATSGEYAPRLDQVISRGVTIDFGTY